MKSLSRGVKTILYCIAIVVAIFLVGWWSEEPVEQELGVTFSTVYARELGLDPRETYLAILDDLQVRRIRLPAYWSEIEPVDDQVDFGELDWMIEEAVRRDVEVTLAIGVKLPRWPECFVPDWAEPDQVVDFMRLVVERYKGSPAVVRWQVENEPYFRFGICPEPDLARVDRELALVRSLDDRPIMMTVSGEIEAWGPVAGPADAIGFSLYRVVWDDLFGYIHYPQPPWFYRVRAFMVSREVDDVIISELQAEPWLPEPLENRTPEEWSRVFDANDLRANVDYAARTGIAETYLWGAEWWYWQKQNGQSGLWEEAKKIFAGM